MSSKLSLLSDLAGGQVPTDLVYIDDLSAGASGSKKSTLNDFLEQITKNITDAVLKGIQGSGTNGAGANLGLSGGKGTGNANPGQVAVRFPLRGASGSTVQSLSTGSFPVSVNLYTNTTGATSLANSTTETSVFNGAGAAAGSTLTIQGGQSSPGTRYKATIIAGIATTGGVTGRIRVKLGGTTLCDTGAVVLPNTGAGALKIEFDIRVVTVGAAGTASIDSLRADFSTSGSGIGTVTSIFAVTNPIANIDFTADQALDVTFQFGTANVANVFNMVDAIIDIIR